MDALTRLGLSTTDYANLKIQASQLGIPTWQEGWLILALLGAKQRGILGLAGGQGVGKSTLGAGLTQLWTLLGLKSRTISLDDFYLTQAERAILPFRYRGPPGTHDLALAIRTLTDLRAGVPTWVPHFDKSAGGTAGERFQWPTLRTGMALGGERRDQALIVTWVQDQGQPLPWPPAAAGASVPCAYFPRWPEGSTFEVHIQETTAQIQGDDEPLSLPVAALPQGWDYCPDPLDLILFEGWCVGYRPLAGTRSEPDAERANQALIHYQALWQQVDQLWVLDADAQQSKTWRKQAEQVAQRQGKAGMTEDEVDRFVAYFWQVLPPTLYLPPLLQEADLVITVGPDHRFQGFQQRYQARAMPDSPAIEG